MYGILLVTMEPAAVLEEEFNDWYDNEHVPERRAIPGFLNGLRMVCVKGWPRYLAVYDLEHVRVLDSQGYRDVSGDRFSPWSKRVLNRVRGQYRAAGEQVYPGQAVTGRFGRLLLIRLRGLPLELESSLIDAARQAYEPLTGVKQLRVFRIGEPAHLDHLIVVESTHSLGVDPLASALFAPFSDKIDVVNEYAPYWVRGHLPGVFAQH
jgi:hypothetical protein